MVLMMDGSFCQLEFICEGVFGVRIALSAIWDFSAAVLIALVIDF